MKDPAFLFYPGDYLRDTQCLSESVQVAYDRIMCEHMRNICISQQQLKFFTKRLSDDERDELMMVLSEVDGGYQITWVAESIVKRKAYSESRRQNRSKSSKNISSSYDKHMENENENVIEDITVIEKEEKNDDENSFQIWWDLYAKKVDQKKCFARWKKYNHDTRVEIWRHTKKYIEATPDKQFRRNPLTYLNGENWKDTELLEAKKTHTGPGNGKVPVNDYLDNLLSGGQTEQKQIN